MGKENPGNAVNLLCEGTVIVGDIKTKNDIRIDGIIKGKIITSGRLVVGNTAKIEAVSYTHLTLPTTPYV